MKRELEQKFYERWPEWFRGRNETVQTSSMPFGFEHDDGWFDLEWQLCEALERAEVGPEYKLFQVKEKFGTLRWYDSGGNEEARNLVRQAERDAGKICEVCGNPGGVCSTGGWLKTLCDTCLNLPEFKACYKKCEKNEAGEWVLQC